MRICGGYSQIVLMMLIFVFSAQYQPIIANESHDRSWSLNSATKFIRTELYFGMDKSDGTMVEIEEWNKFLAEEVTPRFPDGFTILEGFGQYKDNRGKIIKEKSRLLIFLYRKQSRRANNEKIEQIRLAYKKMFAQESVLRLDFRQTVEVSF